MRLAGQIRGGFFPAAKEAVDEALKRILVPRGINPIIFDPCAGKGAAIKQLGEGLGIPQSAIYANELSPDLGAGMIESMPEANAIINSDFTSLTCTARSFSLIWCNPPFDYTLDKTGRVEFQFARIANEMLVDGGLMAFVIPAPVIDLQQVQLWLCCNYDRLSMFEFPEPVRKFKEIVILGERRREAHDRFKAPRWRDAVTTDSLTYKLRDGRAPVRFKKTQLTAEEIAEELYRSPLRRRLKFVKPPPIASPPLSLGDGHIALLVAAGQLDGLIEPPDEPPHVVRGTAKKVEYLDSVEESEDEDTGKVKTVTILKQRIVITVRAIDQHGEIKTFTDEREGDRDVGSEPIEENKGDDDDGKPKRTTSSPD